MPLFFNSLIVPIRTIHQTLTVDTVSHPKGMTKLMINNLHQKLNIDFTLVILLLISLLSISFFDHLFIRHDACSIFDRTKTKNPFFLE